MSGTELPKISDETVNVFLRAAHEAGAGAYISGGEGRLEVNDDHVRAGLAAALVASGYRREADVQAEIAATLRSAAAGRREYADGMPRGAAWEPSVELMNMQATTLESAALVTEGNLEPLYNWLPSWRWTDEMMANLYRDRATALEQAQPLLAAGSEPLVCGCGIPPDGAPGASGCSSSCMLPVPVAAGSEVEQGQERSEEKRCPNCAPGYDCERGIYGPVSSTGEEKTDGR